MAPLVFGIPSCRIQIRLLLQFEMFGFVEILWSVLCNLSRSEVPKHWTSFGTTISLTVARDLRMFPYYFLNVEERRPFRLIRFQEAFLSFEKKLEASRRIHRQS